MFWTPLAFSYAHRQMLQLPSVSNSAGTVLGAIAGAAVVAAAPSWPFVITLAAAFGTTPLGVAGVLAIAATAAANYLVTHIAQVKDLDGMLAKYWPQIEAKYPGNDGSAPTNTSNINK